MPFLATKSQPQLAPRNQSPPGIALYPLDPGHSPVIDKFTLPHRASIKLVVGCGCWLRRVENKPDYATVEDLVQDPKYNPALEQPNHDALVDFLQQHFSADGFVEFYGCNDGDYAAQAREHLQIHADDIRRPTFHFRVGSHYTLLFR